MKKHNLFDTLPNLFPTAETIFTAASEMANKFPYFNIYHDKDKDNYLIELAVAGFSKQDLEVANDNGILVINGKKLEDSMPQEYAEWLALYRNIALRNFTRKFVIGLDYEVSKVQLKDGILKISINRIAQTKKSKLNIED